MLLGWLCVSASQRAIHYSEHLCRRQLIHATTEAVEVTLAAKLLARKARERILHHPDVAAVLHCARVIPRPLETADRPGADQARTRRAVESDGPTARGRRKMRG